MAKRNRRFLALALTLVLAFSLMSAAMATGESTAQLGGKIEPSTSNPVVIGTKDNLSNFFVAIKQAQDYTCWTAINIEGDTAAQGVIKALVLGDEGKGQTKFSWEFHTFDPNNVGIPFAVFPNGTEQYGGQATISIDGNDMLAFSMDASKWSHLDYGTYGETTPPATTSSLTVTKAVSVTLDGVAQSIPSGYSVTFNVYASSDTGYSTSLGSATIDSFTAGSGSTTINGLDNGDYVVVETVTGAPAGYTRSETGTANVTISGGNETAAFTNSYFKTTTSPTPPPVPTPYSLQVTKAVSVTLDSVAQSIPSGYSVTFNVYASADAEHSFSLGSATISSFPDEKGSTTIGHLGNGNYVVVETVTGAPDGYTKNETGTASVTISGGNETAAFTNSYSKTTTPSTTPPTTPPTGSLTVTKTISGLPTRTSDYTVDVTVNNMTKTITIPADASSGSVTFDGLEAKSYTVNEANVTGVPTGYEANASASTVTTTAKVTEGQTATASLTNVYSDTTPGTVIITPTTPVTEIPEPEVPTTDVPTIEDPVTEITDPETPLADAAAQVTGDTLVLWIALACVSAVALVYIILIDKKHRNDTNR